MRLPTILLGLAALSPQDAPPERPPLERAGVLELTLPEPLGVRVEHFRLDAPGLPAGAAPLGVARLLRVPDRDGVRLEWETRIFAAELRVLLVERLTASAADLVWRELGRGGRTLHVAWDLASTAVEVKDAAGAAVRRRVEDAGAGLCTPLFLLEEMRAGYLSAGDFRRLDPNSGAIEGVRFEPAPAYPLPLIGPGPACGLRWGRWTRADGSLLGRYLLRGREVLGYQIQRGGPIARAIPSDAYAAHVRAARSAPQTTPQSAPQTALAR